MCRGGLVLVITQHTSCPGNSKDILNDQDQHRYDQEKKSAVSFKLNDNNLFTSIRKLCLLAKKDQQFTRCERNSRKGRKKRKGRSKKKRRKRKNKWQKHTEGLFGEAYLLWTEVHTHFVQTNARRTGVSANGHQNLNRKISCQLNLLDRRHLSLPTLLSYHATPDRPVAAG